MSERKRVYLDVDGVLLDKHLQPAQCLHEFVAYVTTHFDCYWATTHVIDGSTDHVRRVLERCGVPAETRELLEQVRGTSWDMLKTDAIDLTSDFLWFEDMPTEGERAALRAAGKEDNLVWIDRAKGDGLCQWLATEKETPQP